MPDDEVARALAYRESLAARESFRRVLEVALSPDPAHAAANAAAWAPALRGFGFHAATLSDLGES